jgi:hypothetical protein
MATLSGKSAPAMLAAVKQAPLHGATASMGGAVADERDESALLR